MSKESSFMPLEPIPYSFSVRDLQRNYREVIEVAKQSKDAVILLNNSRPEAVILDAKTYNELVREVYPYDESFTLAAIAHSKASVKKGKLKKLVSWDDLDD